VGKAQVLASGDGGYLLERVRHSLGVSALPTAQQCYVRPAADFVVAGGSLWSIEGSPGQRWLVGWDEARGRALEGEELAGRRSP